MDTFLLLLLLLFVFFFITCFIYQFLLRKSPWKYCTSWFSSFAKYYSCAVIVAVVVTFVVLLKVVPLVLILTAIPRILRELMQVFFFFFFYILKVFWHQLWELLFFLVSLSQKEILTQREHFKVWNIQGMVLIVQIIDYVVFMSLFKATIHKT